MKVTSFNLWHRYLFYFYFDFTHLHYDNFRILISIVEPPLLEKVILVWATFLIVKLEFVLTLKAVPPENASITSGWDPWALPPGISLPFNTNATTGIAGLGVLATILYSTKYIPGLKIILVVFGAWVMSDPWTNTNCCNVISVWLGTVWFNDDDTTATLGINGPVGPIAPTAEMSVKSGDCSGIPCGLSWLTW